MPGVVDLAIANLTSPMVLFFALGLAAALARSDLTVPEAIAKGMALYLLLAIGFKGGVSLAAHGLDGQVFAVLAVGIGLSFAIPVLGFAILRATTKLSAVDAAAVSAHYGSISIVTFVAASEMLRVAGMPFPGYMVAVAAAMESPAILAALWLAHRTAPETFDAHEREGAGSLLREIALNGSIVLLLGAFAIGVITGAEGQKALAPFIESPFKGVLCLFLLDMGLIAGRGLREGRRYLSATVVAFGIYMPILSAGLAGLCAMALGLSGGGKVMLMTLAASASYIAVPAALRLALPQARPAIYLTMALGVTFPFNLTLGIPLYMAFAQVFG